MIKHYISARTFPSATAFGNSRFPHPHPHPPQKKKPVQGHACSRSYGQQCVVGRKHGALRPHKPLRLIRDGEVGEGSGFFVSNTCSLHCHHQNDCIKVGSCVSHFNVSLIVWAKSQDSVHKPQYLKRRERTAEADRTKVLLLTSQAPYR